MAKKKTTKKNPSKFGEYLGGIEENGETIDVYRDGNQIYQVKNGKLMKDRTLHVDDIDLLIATLFNGHDEKEAK